jgi:hypothetical protein
MKKVSGITTSVWLKYIQELKMEYFILFPIFSKYPEIKEIISETKIDSCKNRKKAISWFIMRRPFF